MSYGITSINNSGFTQIDETSEAFLVIQTGTKAQGQTYVTLSNTLPSDILVFARPAGGGTSGVGYVSGYVLDYVISGTRYVRAYMGGSIATNSCDYAVVKRSSQFTTPTSGYGMSVFTSSGALAYTTEQPMFRAIAARSVTLTAASGAFDAAWYQGAVGSIDTAYVMLGPFGTYQYEQYASMGENFSKHTHRKAKLDWNNHTVGTTSTVDVNDVGNDNSVFVRTNAGQRTELMGYIV